MHLDPTTKDKSRASRIKLVKKFLRYMPRKAMLHKYPFLKYFANYARKRHYLWSFRISEAVPALYAGFILSLAPLYGMQIPLAFALALLFKANLMILVGLQFITNPLTVLPIYTLCYKIGGLMLDFLNLKPVSLAPIYEAETGASLKNITYQFSKLFIETMMGGILLGYLCGLISSITYRYFANKFAHKEISSSKKIHTKKK